jgi:AcrR family transcriptional regulator
LSTPARPRRADAARNRARVLEVADQVFGEQGPAGSTEEVARRAGVGIATVFRHFPTKEALLGAVLAARLERIAALADELADRTAAGGDPASAFFELFGHVIAQAHSKRLLTEALTDAGVVPQGPGDDLRRAVGRLLGAAQGAGAVRADIGVDEVFPLMAAAVRAAEASRDAAVGDRAVGVLLDGLRAR